MRRNAVKSSRDFPNVGVRNGAWGEDTAVAHLRGEGYVIVERNSRPCRGDRRLEIDIVAYDRPADAMVFVEVKQHKSHREGESALRGVDRRKMANLRRAFEAWRRLHRWRGSYRFDVIEVFGSPGCARPEVRHMDRIGIFTPPERFVRWA